MAHAVCACAGADASPSDSHMARGPARKRGVRLSEAEASAVVDYVCTDSGSKVPLSAFGQLLRDACRDSPHEVLDTQSVRLKLRSRALLLENSGCAPSEDADWGDDEKWSTEFAKKVRSMWGKFRQNGSFKKARQGAPKKAQPQPSANAAVHNGATKRQPAVGESQALGFS